MPPLIPAEDQKPPASVGGKPGTTTISTIAVRAEPHTTIVIAMLNSQGDIHLRIDEMSPRLLEIGETMEEAETLFDSHTDLAARLATKESQVEELLTRANELAHEQEEDYNIYVYESMADSLTLAWKELNKQLELRGYILEDVLRFHELAKQHEKTQRENLLRIEEIVQKNIPQSPLATKVESLKVSINKFLDELQNEGRSKNQVEIFLQNANIVLNQLDQMERDLKVASAALAAELAPLAKQKTKKVIDEGSQILRQEDNLKVREVLESLHNRLRQVEELAAHRVSVNRRLSEKLIELNEWLKTTAEPFLADNGHVGGSGQSAAEFLNAHKQFETQLFNKEQEVNSVIQQCFELNEEGQQQIKEFRQRYEVLKGNLERRIEMGTVLQKIFKLNGDLDKSLQTLADSLNDSDLYKNELAFNDLTNLLHNVQESLAQEKHQVEKFSALSKSAQNTDLNLRSQKVEESLSIILNEHQKIFEELQEELRNWQLKRDARKAASKTVEEVQIWQVETTELIGNLETKFKEVKAGDEGKVKKEIEEKIGKIPLKEQQEKIGQVQQHVEQSQDAELGQKLDYLHRDQQLLKRRLSDLEQELSHLTSETVTEEQTTVITRFPTSEVVQHQHQIPRGHAPNLIAGLENLEVTEGQPVEFCVKIDSEPPSKVQWLKDGRVIKSSPDYRQHFDGEVATLRIDETFLEDSANYTFVAENLHGTAQSVAQLTVRSRSKNPTPLEDKPRFVRQLQNVDVREGTTAVLECVCVAKPEPQVTWCKEESVIRESDRIRIDYTGDKCVLRILGANSGDAGLYKVIAKNIHGESINFCRLQVQSPQPTAQSGLPPHFDPPLTNQVVVEGEPATLEVKAFGEPIPKVEWTLNNNQIQEDGNVKVGNEPDGWSRVKITSVQHDNTGLYAVRAINNSGEARTAATLNLIPQPRPSQVHHQQSQQSITRRSSSPRTEHYNQEKQILIQQLQKVHQDYHSNYSSTERATPTSLHKTQSAYENRFPQPEDCTDFGFSSLANAPQFIRPFQEEYTVNEGEKIQLDCLMVGNPRPKVQWFFNDRPIKSNWQFAEFPNIGDTYYISFAPAKLENAGYYRIVAENVRGRTESTTLIHIRPKSMIPPPSRKTPQRFIQKDFGATDYAPSPTYYSDRGSTSSPARRIMSQSAYQPRDHGPYERFAQSQSPQYYTTEERYQNEEIVYSPSSQGYPQQIVDSQRYPQSSPGPQRVGGGYIGVPGHQNIHHVHQSGHDEYTAHRAGSEGRFGSPATQRFSQGQNVANYPVQGGIRALGHQNIHHVQQDGHGEYIGHGVQTEGQFVPPGSQRYSQDRIVSNQSYDQVFSPSYPQEFAKFEEPNYSQQEYQEYQQSYEQDELDLARRSSDAQPPHFIQTLQSYVASIGENVQFDAIVTANPEPEIVWTKDGHLIDQKVSPHLQFVQQGEHIALIVNNAQPEDCGKYMCSVRNVLGVATSSAQFVVRPNTVAPDFIQRLISEEVAEGQPLRWTVKTTGDPEPHVVWLRNGEPIPNCPEVQLITEGPGVHSLFIPAVEQADGGQFTCVAENVAGEARSTADLVVRPAGSEPGAYFHITKVTQEKRVNGEDVAQSETFAIESPK
uniref:Dystrophin n=1 Tax=Bursaphelenchus xylophilus TaxID=6326 RepID=A0A1I7S8H7_BURXY